MPCEQNSGVLIGYRKTSELGCHNFKWSVVVKSWLYWFIDKPAKNSCAGCFDHLKKNNSIKLLLLALLISVAVRLMGLAKEATIANFFGVSATSDVYFIFLILATFFVEPVAGSISPALTSTLRKMDDWRGKRTNAVIVTTFLVISVLIILFFSNALLQLVKNLHGTFNVGFIVLTPKFNLVTQLYPIGAFSVITVIAHAVLISQGRFVSLQFTPIFVSLSIIIGCYLLDTELDVSALFLLTSFGFLIEAILCLALIRNLLVNPVINWSLESRLISFNLFKRWPTLAISSLVMSASMVVDQSMAIFLGDGGPSLINYGSKFTMGLISLAAIFSTFVFPFFIDLAKSGEFAKLQKNYFLTQVSVILIGFTFIIILVGFSETITYILFERGEFTAENTSDVSALQAIYFLHIPFYISLQFTMKFLHALERTNLHLIINLSILISNASLNFVFMKLFGVLGIALATFITYFMVAIFWICLFSSKNLARSILKVS